MTTNPPSSPSPEGEETASFDKGFKKAIIPLKKGGGRDFKETLFKKIARHGLGDFYDL
jgi:hypothetical protein